MSYAEQSERRAFPFDELELFRWFFFVGVNTVVVFGCCVLLCANFPPLRNEPLTLIAWPMTAIAFFVSLILHRFVRRTHKSGERFVAFYLAFVVGLVMYGIYLASWQQYHTGPQGLRMMDIVVIRPSSIMVALYFGHIMGLPVFLLLGVTNKLLSPILCPREI